MTPEDKERFRKVLLDAARSPAAEEEINGVSIRDSFIAMASDEGLDKAMAEVEDWEQFEEDLNRIRQEFPVPISSGDKERLRKAFEEAAKSPAVDADSEMQEILQHMASDVGLEIIAKGLIAQGVGDDPEEIDKIISRLQKKFPPAP